MNGERTALLDGTLASLHRTLEEVIQLQQQLVATLQEEKRVIVESDLARLTVCVSEKEALLNAIRQLEARWRTLVEPIARRFGLAEAVSLRQLIAVLAEPDRSQFQSCLERLSALRASMIELNQVNRLLIDKTLKKISELMEFLRHLSNNSQIYRATGTLSRQPATGRLLSRG